VQEAFVFRELAHEAQDERGVGRRGRAYREHGAYVESPRTAVK
jgi:hypothetical protein